MGVSKRGYKTKDGEKVSKYWKYEFFIDSERFQDTLNRVTKLPEGYEFPEGKTLETLTKKQAQEIEDALKKQKIKELNGGEKKQSITFDEAAALFYQAYILNLNKRREAAPHKKIRDYYNNIILTLVEHFTGLELIEINKTHFATFRTKRRGQGVKDKTIRNDLLCVSSLYTFAADEGLYEEDDIPNFKQIIKTLQKSKQRTRHLSVAEYDRLIAQYKTLAIDYNKSISKHGRYSSGEEPDNPFNTRARKRMVMFAVDTGVRSEEMFSLLAEDIFFNENKFMVRETKNGEDRTLPMSALSRELLQEQLQENLEAGIKSPYAFCKTDGTRFTEISKGFRGDCKRAAIKGLQIRDLRRTFGCWRLRGVKEKKIKKMRMEEVSKLLGHSSIAITETVYAFLDVENIKLD